jgi:hypothetical protein
MGNKQSQQNKVGHLETMSADELQAYEEKCRADPGRILNNQRCYLGLDLASESGFLGANESLYEVVQRDHAYVTQRLGPLGHEKIAFWLSSLSAVCHKRNEDADRIQAMDEYLEQQGHAPQAAQWLAELRIDQFEGTSTTYGGNQSCPFWKRVQAIDKDGKPMFTESGTPEMDDAMHGCQGGVDYVVWRRDQPDVRFVFCALNVMMIRYHHFYEGSVPHRVDPAAFLTFIK